MSRARHKKAEGGRIGMKVAGNPDVFKEAAEKHGSRKHGGKVGKHLGAMHGGKSRHRADRPARKSGGRVGSNNSPLSSAHKGSMGGGTTPKSADSYGGTPAD